MAYKIISKVVLNEHKNYDYGYSDRKIVDVTYKGYEFRCNFWSYHENASEDEPSYDEASSDCICCTTEDFIAEDKCDFTEDIIAFVNDEIIRQKKYEEYIKEQNLPF